MPKKKKEDETPETSTGNAEEPEDQDQGQSELRGKDDTPEFAAEQSEAMSDIMDDDEPDLNELAQQPAEEDQEPESQPEPKAEEAAKPEGKGIDSEKAEAEPAAKDKEKLEKDQKAGEPEKKTPEDKNLDVIYEVIEGDGVKQVPVKNLITTYQQYGNLQKRHTAIKPLFELMEKAGQPVEMLYPYLEVGIAYMQQIQNASEGRTPNLDVPGVKPAILKPDIPEQQPGQYQGPFESAEKDEYYQEVDPDLHSAMWRMWNVAVKGQTSTGPDDIGKRISALEQASARVAQDNMKAHIEDGKREIENRITQWAGPHNDYFNDAQKGPERLEGFKKYIIGRYPETKIKELTPEFLSAVFASFDPVYYNQYLQNLAAKQVPEDKPGTFSESSAVRQAAAKLGEQEKYMADLL